MLLLFLDGVAFVCALGYLRSWLSLRRQKGLSLPPGPKGLPLVGNLFDMPGSNEWETACQWGEKYGKLVSIRNFGSPSIFVNSYDTAIDLFEKRGHIYSSRPHTTMLELEGWSEWFMPSVPYGDDLRKTRQYLHQFFQQSALPGYHQFKTQSTHKMLLNLLENPDGFFEHVRHSAGEVILMIVYGYQADLEDPYIKLVDKGTAAWAQAETFFLANLLPILRHLPEWFPGTEFLQIAKEGHKLCDAMRYNPHEQAKARLADGTAVPSMTSKLIQKNTDEDGKIVEEDLIARTTGVVVAAAADTTVSATLTVILALLLNPEALRRGQEELDRVIGKDNLPTFEDRPNLPYINAICLEALRWQTVVPLGVPHTVTADDVYNGYFIPAGTTLYGNAWAMLRDPKRYPQPEKFIPERWLPSDGKEPPLNPNKLAFGFGRRICPGIQFTEDSTFIAVSSMVAAFDIEPVKDKSGAPIIPPEDYTESFIRHPKPFKCSFTPRSSKIAPLIRQVVDSAR